jgi:hypothetical protein
MSDLILTKARLTEGVWTGVLTRKSTGTEAPRIEVLHLQQPLEGVEIRPLTGEAGAWSLHVPVPARLISDGVQTFLVNDVETGETIGDFALLSGDALAHDIRVEMSLLREELDLLKRAFRRHCLETM